MELLRSRDNPRIKDLVKLMGSKRERDKRDLFVCEGVRLCLDCLDSGVEIRDVYITGKALHTWPKLATLVEHATASWEIDGELARKIGDTENSQGVFAACKKLDNSQSAVTINRDGRYLLLNGLQDPGNLGTILRTAEAMGIDGVFVGGGSVDIYSPKVLRASMGGIFRLPTVACGDMPGQVQALRDSGLQVFAAGLTETALDIRKVNLGKGCCILVGNEGNGLPGNLISACNGTIKIPMPGGAESLNAGVAAAILLWEMTK